MCHLTPPTFHIFVIDRAFTAKVSICGDTQNRGLMKTLALALALFAVPLAAQAATRHHHTSHAARGAQARVHAQAQIACTQYGCLPVPRGCYRESGRTHGDMPSGFDVITCPGSGTLYGNR